MNIFDILHQLGYNVHGVRVGTYNVSHLKELETKSVEQSSEDTCNTNKII